MKLEIKKPVLNFKQPTLLFKKKTLTPDAPNTSPIGRAFASKLKISKETS